MKRTQGILFVAVGGALVAFSQVIASPIWSAVLLNFGLVSMAVVLIEYLWGVAGGHPLERQVSSLSDQIERLAETVDIVDASERVGLGHVHDCLANFGSQADWENLIRGAEARVDLMGRTLFG